MLGDRARDGAVERAVQDLEFVGCNGSVLLNSQFSNGLANVAVVVHHLREIEAQLACNSRPCRAADLPIAVEENGVALSSKPKGFGKLRQEERDTVFKLTCRGKRPRSIRDSRPGAADDVVAMQGHEIVQHRSPLFVEAPDADCEASACVPSQDPIETSDATATERRSQCVKESVGVAQANMIRMPAASSGNRSLRIPRSRSTPRTSYSRARPEIPALQFRFIR